ncbi:hypothetical protein B0I35DRAFT_409981 [Stachybotrys elegans]|uniref:Uncharacterized protein n=1 Tax=Stachybotrys elegans TaxID=80388 RepID=A0A8K0SQ05_9HYPO|nr:hypothetical protein B0I35DRAFT_409981 [Stachybotrys elegans]
MVSLFGLKLGGDRKKSLSKASKPAEPKKRIDQNTLGEGQYFGRDLPRPQPLGTRPGTSASSRGPVMWNAPYAGPIGATSMVDLSMPAPGRKESFNSLRAPNPSGITYFSNGSGISLALPPPPSMLGIRPGTPTRPGTPGSRTKEWRSPGSRPQTRARRSEEQDRPLATGFDADDIDPLTKPSDTITRVESFSDNTDVPGTPLKPRPARSGSAKSVLTYLELANRDGRASSSTTRESSNERERPSISSTGYPSPPKSYSALSFHDEPRLSRTNSHAPSNLRRVDTAERPPSPPSSAELPAAASPDSRISDEQWNGPVIRNVQAKRDTLTYHPPKRRSFTMEVQQFDRFVERGRNGSFTREYDHGSRTEGIDWRPKKPQQVEGLAGNFDAFDFGESVRTPTVGSRRAESPMDPRQRDPSPDKPRGRRRPSPTGSATHDESRPGPRRPSPPMRSATQLQETSPFDSNESPVDPTKRNPWAKDSILNRDRPRIYADRPRTAPGPGPALPTGLTPPPPPPNLAQRRAGPPRSAAGIRPGNSHDPDAAVFEGLGPRPADSALRRFESRDDANPRSRSRAPPPQPLSLRSHWDSMKEEKPHMKPASTPHGPPIAETNYMRTGNERPPLPPGDLPTPPTQDTPTDRPLSSPFNRPPMAGDFPKSKGLPRGRRPDPLHLDQSQVAPPPLSSASSRWRAWPSPGFLGRTDSPTYQQQQDAVEAQGYSLPNWDEFDSVRDRHQSAIPAPLSPLRGEVPGLTWYASSSPWSPSSSSFTSTTAPRLPSPTFPSLEKSISSTSAQLAKSFELFYDEPAPNDRDAQRHQPLISPVLGSFPMPREPEPEPERERSREPSSNRQTLRIDAQKAPPRPAPVAVPPSAKGVKNPLPAEFAGAPGSPTLGREFHVNFI